MRLVSFDMDGTLIRGTTASLFMAEQLGHDAQTRELEHLFDTGMMTAPEFAEREAPRFAGLPITEVERLFAPLPLIGGIADAVAILRRRGIPCVISTVSYSHYAGVLARRFGFDGHCGAVMHEQDGVLQGRMHRHCTPDDKRVFVETYARERGIAMADVAHIGDSLSDLPLFAVVGRAIALNATPNARAVAHDAIDTDHLPDALALLGLD